MAEAVEGTGKLSAKSWIIERGSALDTDMNKF